MIFLKKMLQVTDPEVVWINTDKIFWYSKYDIGCQDLYPLVDYYTCRIWAQIIYCQNLHFNLLSWWFLYTLFFEKAYSNLLKLPLINEMFCARIPRDNYTSWDRRQEGCWFTTSNWLELLYI